MRLIDADKITMTRQEYVGALTLKERLQRLLKFQPTVEAIPVEWIKEWNTQHSPLIAGYVAYMLLDWKKENEREIDKH